MAVRRGGYWDRSAVIIFREPGVVTTWFVAFHRGTDVGWWRYVVPGRYKHVSLFGYCVPCRTWVFIEVALGGITVQLLPEGTASEAILASLTPDCDVLVIEARPIGVSRPRLRPLSCTSFICDVLGLRRGALLPVSLWRLLLRSGAKIVSEASHPAAAGP